MQVEGYNFSFVLFKNSSCTVYEADKNNESFIIKLISENTQRSVGNQRLLKEYEIGCKLGDCSSYFLKPVQFIDTTDHIGIVWKNNKVISLTSFIKRNTINISLFLEISIQIVEALHILHSKGIIHRDISPNNILINEKTNKIFLSDFGSSCYWREFESNNLPSKLGYPSCGTYQYLSPEHTGKVNRPIDYRSDLYSLGIVFYELLSGNNPFKSIKGKLALLYAHVTVDLPPLFALLNCKIDVPIVLSNIISKLLKKPISERYQSCLGLLYDLNQCKNYMNIFIDSSVTKITSLYSFVESYLLTNEDISQLDVIQEYIKTIPLEYTDNSKADSPLKLGEKDKSSILLSPYNIYGRDKELKLIKNLFASTSNENVAIRNTGAIILGYSGSGKTSLINYTLDDICKMTNNSKQIILVKTKFPQFSTSPFKQLILIFNELLSTVHSIQKDIYLQMEKHLGLKKLAVLGEQLIPSLHSKYKLPELENIPAADAVLRLQDITCIWIEFLSSIIPNVRFIIYLDDIQWADQNSISMIKTLLKLQDVPLFFIFAARDNEILDNHDIQSLLKYLHSKNPSSIIQLPPLDTTSTTKIIAEMTSSDSKYHTKLSEITVKKTNGNPFFITQFITSLYLNELLYFNLDKQEWEYKINDIDNLEYTSNVVHLLLKEISKLSKNAKYVIQTAACIGYTFSLDLLCKIVDLNQDTILECLLEALNIGFIQPKHNEFIQSSDDLFHSIIEDKTIVDTFIFLHDKVHEGFYTCIEDDKKESLHYKIGLLLMDRISQSKPEEIINVLHHLIKGKNNIKDNNISLKIVDTAISAANIVKNLGCFTQALEYGLFAKDLLLSLYSKDDCWKTEYKRTFDACLVICTTGSVTIGISRDNVESYFKFVDGYIQDKKDKLEFYLLHSRYLVTSELYGELFTLCLNVLKEYGYPISPTLSFDELKKEIQITESQYPISIPKYLVNQNIKADDSCETALCNFIIETGISVFLAGKLPVFCMMYLTGLRIILKYNVGICAPLFSGFGFALQGVFGPSFKAIEYGIEADKLTKVIAYSDRLMSKTYFFCGLIGIFTTSFGNKMFDKAFHYSAQSYDYGTVGYSLHQGAIGELFKGTELSCKLEVVKPKLELAKSKFERFYDMLIIYSVYEFTYFFIHNKLPQDIITTTDGKPVNIEKLLEVEGAPGITISQILFIQMKSYYLLGNPEALTLLSKITILPFGSFFYYSLPFMASLVRIKFNPDDPTLKDYINESISKLTEYGQFHPNFQMRLYLLQGEAKRLENPNSFEAYEFYNKAITLAAEHNVYHIAGMAAECAYRFLKANDYVLGVLGCLDQALYFYKKWGATTKCKILTEEKSTIKGATSTPNNSASESSSDSILHDTILENVTKLLTTEYKTEESIKVFCEMILQHAGADKGCVCYKYKDDIYVLAEWTKNKRLQVNPHPTENTKDKDVYLASKQESLTIPYEKICSLIISGNSEIIKLNGGFCVPIQSRKDIVGVVFLENTLLTDIFPMNQTLLKHLICQIVSIIERNELNNSLKKSLEKEQKRADMLEDLNKMKDNFVATTSHELRTPLNGILGFTELLKETNLNNEQKEHCDMIYAAGTGLLSIINDILDFQKCQNNEVKVTSSQFDFRKSIDHILRLVSVNTEHIDIRLDLDEIFSSEFWIECDSLRIQQVLLNLMSNAVKFTQKGSVTLSIKKETNSKIIDSLIRESDCNCVLLISVIDTGIGISKKNMDELFKPFSQLDSGTTRKYSGTGLGLVVSQKLVKILSKDKCKIECKSTFREGTTFYFHLPVKLCSSNELNKSIELRNYSIQLLDKSIHIIYTQSEHTKNSYLYETQEVNIHTTYFPKSLDKVIDTLIFIRKQKPSYNIVCGLELAKEELDFVSEFITKVAEYLPCLLFITTLKGQAKYYSLSSSTRYPFGFIVKPFYKNVVINNAGSAVQKLQNLKMNNSTRTLENSDKAAKDISLPDILLVEDNKMNQKLLIRMIKLLNKDCDIAENGKEGVEAYIKRQKINKPYKLILMDYHMPIMDGKEATESIRKLEIQNKYPHAHIIGITADSAPKFADTCSVFKKPLKKDTLNHIISKYFSNDCELAIQNRELPNILLVEDNKMNQKLLIRMIKLLNKDCDIAENGKEGVEAYIKRQKINKPYELILMDLHMPIMDGNEAARNIRKLETENNFVHSHIIGLTADVGENLENMCSTCDKPVKKQKLNYIITKYMHQSTSCI